MNHTAFIGLFIAIVLGFHSCTEDEFLEPTSVDLKVKMVNSEPFDNLPAQANIPSLKFSKGTFYLTGIEFDGKRENNDNHYFHRKFDNVLVADLSDNSLNQQVTFDIPRGSYNPIKIRLHTNGPDSLSGLTFKGKWKRQKGKSDSPPGRPEKEVIPVEINFFKDYKEELELTLNTETGNEQIVFDGNNWNTLEIKINLAHMFKNFNPENLERATIQGQGGKQKIIISRSHNNDEDMYYSLVNRVEKSITAVIK